jgi:predicted Rossmann fold nucleotide-binding protein DprA/Smf involved in DNA uptake
MAISVPDGAIESERVEELLRRAAPASMELERLADLGIWVMAQTDPDYPIRLTKRLGRGAPPVLFGAGERASADSGGLAVIGSRDSPVGALEAAAAVGRQAAAGGTTIISGAARGIDTAAMEAALEAGGLVIGVVADHLDRRIRERVTRDAIARGRLILVTPYIPTAGFTARTAMGRNKVIYGLADAAVVMTSAAGKGGTWEGAVEAIKLGQPPVFVWQGAAKPGRDALLAAGASVLPSDAEARAITVEDITSWPTQRAAPEPQLALFDGAAETSPPASDDIDELLSRLRTLDLVRLFLERVGEDVPVPSPSLEQADVYLALLGQRAASLYANVHHSFESPAKFAPILAIRPLVELVILTKWISLNPELHGFLYMADSEALELANLKRITEHSVRRGSKPPPSDGNEEAIKAAIQAEGKRRLKVAGVDYGRGRLYPKVERMVEDVVKADPGHEIAMRDTYVLAYRTFSPWEHSSGSSFKATAQVDGSSWRWTGDLSPFGKEDIEAVAASMYAYLLETVLAPTKPEAAGVARVVRDYVTTRWVRSDLVASTADAP